MARRIGLLFFMVGANTSFADQFDTINFTANASINHDNNVFRLPANANTQLLIGSPDKSDYTRKVMMGINIDKKYANQSWSLDANVTNNKYDTFSYLDFNSTIYKAAWKWSLGSKLNGTLSADHSQTLNDFADVRTNTRNLKTTDGRGFSADWWFESDWHLVFGLSDSESASSSTTVNNLNYRNKTSEAGFKYQPADRSSISLLSRKIEGTYVGVSPNYLTMLDAGYAERQQVIQVTWLVTAKSVLSGHLENIKRQHPLISERDYNGMQRGLGYAWAVSDKTHLNVDMDRVITSWLDPTSSYYVTDTLAMTSSWQFNAKADTHATIKVGTSKYLGAVVTNVVNRVDTNKSIEVGLAWAPQRYLRISATAQHALRVSNYSSYEYSDDIVSLSATATF
jgi:exopolysaccharide biosynthesis operon protein EpsL